jgi:hypothetical protein
VNKLLNVGCLAASWRGRARRILRAAASLRLSALSVRLLGPLAAASGNEEALTSDRNQFHEQPKLSDEGTSPDLDAGYRLLEPDETDPNPRTLPPDLRNGMQAALHAQLRGFDVLPLRPDGTQVASDNAPTNDPAIIRERWAGAPRCKVGGVTDGLVVLALDGAHQDCALAAITNTAAIASRIHKGIFLFFRLPAGVRSVEGSLAAGVDVVSINGYVGLPSGSITDGCRWVNRYAIAPAPQWLVDKLAALAASQSQTEGNSVMGAGAAAMEAFRKGQLPDTGAPFIVLPSGSNTPEADEPAEIADAEKDEKDASEKMQHRSETAKVIPIRPAPEEEAVTSTSTAESPHYLQAYQWVESEAPSPIDHTGRETLPKIVAHLRKQFDLPLSEAIELAKIWQHGECDEELPAEEIEQIVSRVYSSDRNASATSRAKAVAPGGTPSKLEAALDAAKRGFRVLPLLPNSKKPFISEWQYAATTDKDQITKMV